MLALLTIAFGFERPPLPGPDLEVLTSTSARFARTRVASDFGTSDISHWDFGQRFRLRARLKPWAEIDLDATQMVTTLWDGPEPEMQRFGRARVLVGPRWPGLAVQLLVGSGQEGAATVSGLSLLYKPVTVAELGGRLVSETAYYRSAVEVTRFSSFRGITGVTTAVQLVFPSQTRFGVSTGYGFRWVGGQTPSLDRTSAVNDDNHDVTLGLAYRPRAR